jgi:hypothetical protein
MHASGEQRGVGAAPSLDSRVTPEQPAGLRLKAQDRAPKIITAAPMCRARKSPLSTRLIPRVLLHSTTNIS